MIVSIKVETIDDVDVESQTAHDIAMSVVYGGSHPLITSIELIEYKSEGEKP